MPAILAAMVVARQGQFETTVGRCYGLNDEAYVGWVNEQLQSQRKALSGEWILDAGCGAGQKTEILARLCEQQNVVGLDLGVEPLEEAASRFGNRPNLDYVQGNILEPPFRPRQFAYGISLGVLHHTPDTRQAFAAFRQLLKDETACVIWIYPTYKEGHEWWLPYFARDFLLLNQGHRVPPRLLRWIAYMLVLTGYPVVDPTSQRTTGGSIRTCLFSTSGE